MPTVVRSSSQSRPNTPNAENTGLPVNRESSIHNSQPFIIAAASYQTRPRPSGEAWRFASGAFRHTHERRNGTPGFRTMRGVPGGVLANTTGIDPKFAARGSADIGSTVERPLAPTLQQSAPASFSTPS